MNMMKMRRISNKDVASLATAMCIFLNFITYLASGCLKVLGVDNEILMPIVYTLLYATFIAAFVMQKRIRPLSVLMPILICTSLLVTICLYPELDEEIGDICRLIFVCIPVYLLTYNYYDENNMKKYIEFFSFVSGAFFSILFMIHFLGVEIFNSLDYQVLSYSIMLPALFYLQKENRKWYETSLLIAMIWLLVFAGGRGPLVCMVGFIAIRLMLKSKKNLILGVCLVIIAMVVVFNFERIVLFIAEQSGELGIQSGLNTYLKYGNVFSDSGRMDIYIYSFERFLEHPFLGYGILGDRVVLGEINRSYPHNLFLEFLLQYGIIITSFLVFIIARGCLKVIKLKKEKKNQYILFNMLFYSTGFAILMFSSSYLIHPEFFALLGILMRGESRERIIGI